MKIEFRVQKSGGSVSLSSDEWGTRCDPDLFEVFAEIEDVNDDLLDMWEREPGHRARPTHLKTFGSGAAAATYIASRPIADLRAAWQNSAWWSTSATDTVKWTRRLAALEEWSAAELAQRGR